MARPFKLTDEQVENILCEIYAGVYDDTFQIAKHYNVSETTIRFILDHKYYTHITDDLKIPLREIKLKIIKRQIYKSQQPRELARQILKDVMDKKYTSKFEIIRKYNIEDAWLRQLFNEKRLYRKIKNELKFDDASLRKAFSLINLETVKVGDIYNSLDHRSDLLLSDLNNIFNRIYIKKDDLQDIANDFGFTKAHIKNIKMNKAWKNYPRPTCN